VCGSVWCCRRFVAGSARACVNSVRGVQARKTIRGVFCAKFATIPPGGQRSTRNHSVCVACSK
uniref:Uncharacterized protein n=1 Tax=Anopheles arabiensis TaxID=7173 RepID=A0A182IG65_ANOAR